MIREYASQAGASHLETQATQTIAHLHKATQFPERRYYTSSSSDSDPSSGGSSRIYDSPHTATPRSDGGRVPPPDPPPPPPPPTHPPPVPPIRMTREFIGLAPNHTEIAEDVIQEERERRLAERVSRRVANIEQNIEMFKQLPSRTGASSSSSGMTGYIAGVPALVGGAGQAARAVAGAVGYLKPGEVVGTIAGGTIAAAAIGGIETGRGIYHTGATAGGMLLDYYLGGDGEEPQSAGSNPEPSMRKKKKNTFSTVLGRTT